MSDTTRRSMLITALATLIVLMLALPLSGCGLLGGGGERAPGADTAAETEETDASVPLVPAKTGDRVAAPWGQGMYIGSVQAVHGDTADVLYDDDRIVREVAISDLVVVTVREWRVGDPVNAVWTTGRFYPGVITAVKDGGIYTVKWDDGDTPTDVEAARIYEGDKD